jgi:hypothetical protein
MRAGVNRQELARQLSVLPTLTAARYKRLARTLRKAQSDTTFVWASPANGRSIVRVAALSLVSQHELADFLTAYERQEQEPYRVTGTLVGIHLRKRTFELETGVRPESITGRIAKPALEETKTAVMNKEYVALVQDTIRLNAVSDHERVTRSLIHLKPQTD